LSLPEAFVNSIKIQLNDADQLIEALNQKNDFVSIRINDAKIKAATLETVAWSKNSFYLSQRPVFTTDPLFHAGCYYVQEASSMFLDVVFKQLQLSTKNLTVLDLCAAPGGKSTHIISLLNTDSLLVANEIIRSRVGILHENLSKWGKPNFIVTNSDAKDFASCENAFDIIVCDAPCSGEGMFRKNEAARSEWSPANVDLCAQRQERIVADVWNSLKPGGYLVYSTCTFNTAENEENVKQFCLDYDAESIPIKIQEQWNVVETHTPIASENNPTVYGYRFYPHKLKGEGFFISVLKKCGAEKTLVELFSKTKNYTPLSNYDKLIGAVGDWILYPEVQYFFIANNYLSFFPKNLFNQLNYFKSKLKLFAFGTTLAELKGKNTLPQQDLANSILLNKDAFQLINLGLEDALHYLKGETNFKLRVENGLVLIGFNQNVTSHLTTEAFIPLGFAKKIDNRINNNYPKSRMIRMQIDFEHIKSSKLEDFIFPFG
jgi:16S rRNA C967 or C1407 C5-methylase (RsmB/RsmF family)/NOL1/NOP2/fmu family ribosome biogenesis protein